MVMKCFITLFGYNAVLSSRLQAADKLAADIVAIPNMVMKCSITIFGHDFDFKRFLSRYLSFTKNMFILNRILYIL
jgi:hypothetical protein